MPTLLLLRHAKAANFAPGSGDEARPLTDRGHRQTAAVATFLRDRGVTVDHVLCSPSTRTRQTLEGLSLDCPVTYDAAIYQAGSATIAESISTVEDSVQTLLVVGHAPGIPTLAQELSGPESDPASLQQIETGYPTATLARLEVESWSELGVGRLTNVHRPD